MLDIVKSRALALLILTCYFVKLETKIVGLWVIQEHRESLLVASLGVAKEYRRLGIGTCILGYIETIAKHMGKRWLETLVLRKNIPVQRLHKIRVHIHPKRKDALDNEERNPHGSLSSVFDCRKRGELREMSPFGYECKHHVKYHR